MSPNDTVNHSGLYLMLARDGRIVAGAGHPDARMVLAAPGGVVPGDYVRKYRLESLLRPGVAMPGVEPEVGPEAEAAPVEATEPAKSAPPIEAEAAAPVEASPAEPPEDESPMNKPPANEPAESVPTLAPEPAPPVKAMLPTATENKAMRSGADKMVRAAGSNKGRR